MTFVQVWFIAVLPCRLNVVKACRFVPTHQVRADKVLPEQARPTLATVLGWRIDRHARSHQVCCH